MALQTVQDSSASENNQPNDLEITRTNKQGRKTLYKLEDRLSVIEQWENRDRANFSFTLEELLNERFGVSPDGIPVVSIQTFYAWRKRVLHERNQQKEKISGS